MKNINLLYVSETGRNIGRVRLGEMEEFITTIGSSVDLRCGLDGNTLEWKRENGQPMPTETIQVIFTRTRLISSPEEIMLFLVHKCIIGFILYRLVVC